MTRKNGVNWSRMPETGGIYAPCRWVSWKSGCQDYEIVRKLLVSRIRRARVGGRGMEWEGEEEEGKGERRTRGRE